MSIPTPGSSPSAAGASGCHDHAVTFYDTERCLTAAVCDFAEPGARDGDGAIVLATSAHHGDFELALGAAGVDIAAMVAADRYLALDARKTLAGFMVGGALNAEIFAHTVAALIERAGASGRRVRIYCEMAALLWDDGHVGAAIALEDAWSDLAATHEFVLLCAFPMRSFEDAQCAAAFKRICDAHSNVIACESHTQRAGAGEQDRQTARLRHEKAELGAHLARLDGQPASARRSADTPAYESPAPTVRQGLLTIDADGRLTCMSAAAEQLLGWTEAQLRGRNAQEAIQYHRPDGSDGASAVGRHAGVFGDGPSRRSERDVFVRHDGTIVPVLCSATARTEGGIVILFSDAAEETARRASAESDDVIWVSRICEALDEDRFELYSQPIVPLGGGAAREELLLRMVSRDGYVISPGAFLPAAETFGLVTEIDRWVIAQAARYAAVGRVVHVNLSAASVADPCLPSFIATQLQKVVAPPSNVIFEVVETALTSRPAAGEEFAIAIRDLGCGLALDDFGTGFGSLANLKRLPVQSLKIDVDFVCDLSTNEATRHLVRAIVDIAHRFGADTIAEGVEDHRTLELLRDYGVDYAQGYLLSHPAPQRDAPRLLRHDPNSRTTADDRARQLRGQLLHSGHHGGE